MSDTTDRISKQLKLWYRVNEPRPSPVPEVGAPSTLPEERIDPASLDRSTASGLCNLRVFEGGQWETSCLRLSAILSDLNESSRRRLLESLGVISSPPPVDPELLEKWIAAISALSASVRATAVMEFFQISWMWGQISPVVNMGLENVLALYRTLAKRRSEQAHPLLLTV